jgi:hypothetical protein
MRKIKIIEHISLDGVIQAPGGPDVRRFELKDRGRDKRTDGRRFSAERESLLRRSGGGGLQAPTAAWSAIRRLL